MNNLKAAIIFYLESPIFHVHIYLFTYSFEQVNTWPHENNKIETQVLLSRHSQSSGERQGSKNLIIKV